MTHKTGPRSRVVAELEQALMFEIMESPATMGEIRRVMQRIDDQLWSKAMRPWEDTTCPTCPKDMDAFAKGKNE